MEKMLNNQLKSDKGSITIQVISAMLLLVVALVLAYIGISNKISAQEVNINKIQSEYNDENIEQEYRETVEKVNK